jgi:hypothetical protein
MDLTRNMSQDDRLPPHPTQIRPKEQDRDASSLPPISVATEFDNATGSEISSLQSDPMDRASLSRFFDHLRPASNWSTGKAILVIFLGSFLFSVLFTSAILAGIIEVHPAAIKSFLKSMFGNG